MILDIPKIEQKDFECGPACVAQILSYYKIPFDIDEIIDYTSNSYKYKDWDYLMAQYMIKKGLHPKIIAFQSLIYDPSWEKLNQKELLNKMEKELEFFYSDSPRLKHKGFLAWHNLGPEISELEEAIKFIVMGGEVILKPLTSSDICSFVKTKIPIICAYDSILLHGMKRGFMGKPDDISGNPMGHVSVISGYNETEFQLVDPSYWYRKEEKYFVNKDRLINSIITRNSQYIVCEK